jgi:hypothetical protein
MTTPRTLEVYLPAIETPPRHTLRADSLADLPQPFYAFWSWHHRLLRAGMFSSLRAAVMKAE